MFRGCKHEDMPPHIYASAQSAYYLAMSGITPQAIILHGDAASGKTTNLRHILHYLTSVSIGKHPNITGTVSFLMFTYKMICCMRVLPLESYLIVFWDLTLLDFGFLGLEYVLRYENMSLLVIAGYLYVVNILVYCASMITNCYHRFQHFLKKAPPPVPSLSNSKSTSPPFRPASPSSKIPVRRFS